MPSEVRSWKSVLSAGPRRVAGTSALGHHRVGVAPLPGLTSWMPGPVLLSGPEGAAGPQASGPVIPLWASSGLLRLWWVQAICRWRGVTLWAPWKRAVEFKAGRPGAHYQI